MMDTTNVSTIQQNVKICAKLCEHYSELLNSYVLDFFTENHWNKLLPNWQRSLEDLTPLQIAKLLNYDETMNGSVWPLSLLALKHILFNYSLSRRKKTDLNIESPLFTKDDKLLKLFWKNVKAKKRHEISIMSKVCYQNAKKTNCFRIVDIGSGLGHLSRMLNYGFGLKICTIEAQQSLSQHAKKLDNEFEQILEKKYPKALNYNQTVHVNTRIRPNITANEFFSIIQNAFNDHSPDLTFGIVGLHPCGDLGATLLKLFSECNNVKFINIVGCCYMKLTTSSPSPGFPLSHYYRKCEINLSYHAKEIACHAIENYIEKLMAGEWWKLKIHTYRAIIETLIINIEPKLKHCSLNSVKYTQGLDFSSYCSKAISKLNIEIPMEKRQGNQINTMENQWKKVVVFYSLRLLMAPLVESLILFDRVLFLHEAGCKAKLLTAFDPKISPRAHILTATK